MGKKIHIGADPFPPYQYTLPDGSIHGSDYEYVCNVFAAAEYDATVHIAEWCDIFKSFEAGKIQALFQVQDTPERLEKYYFSERLRNAVTKVVTADPSLCGISNYEEIISQRLTLGVIEGFANGRVIDEFPKELKRSYADTITLLEAVQKKEIALGICDYGVMQYFIEKNPSLQPCLVEALSFVRPLYIMFLEKTARDDFDTARHTLSI